MRAKRERESREQENAEAAARLVRDTVDRDVDIMATGNSMNLKP